MGAAFPSSRAAFQAKAAISSRIASLLATRGDQSNTAIREIKLANLQSARNRGKSPAEAFKQFKSLLPSQVAAQKAQATAESNFLGKIESAIGKQLQTAETDFSARIQSAIEKQLSAFAIPTAQAQTPIIPTPMIESESQIKQEFQSPVSLIPIAIIGIILGAVLLGKN